MAQPGSAAREPLTFHAAPAVIEGPMNEDLSNLRSPISRLKLSVADGKLVSDIGETFPILSDIPRFVPAENYASDFGRQWNHFRRTQLDSVTGLPLSKDRLARCFCGELSQVAGKRVLEAGSGAGRFTEILLDHGAKLDSFDYSSAVEANAANNGTRPMTLVQADIRQMPFEPASYDYVVCLGVLQHTPNTEESIAKLWEMVRPGGAVVLDHYRLTRWSFPPPIGGGGYLRRKKFLRLAADRRWDAVRQYVDRWFPIYWRHRDNKWMRRVLARIGGINFYYPSLPLASKQDHYEWSLLDTHDATTDYYRRYRTVASIERTLKSLGATAAHVWKGGNGVEAFARKPI